MPKSTRHTADMVNDRLSARGITMIGEYINALTKVTFKCPLDHEWDATPNNVLRGKGCPHCAGRAKLDVTTINQRLADRDIEALLIRQRPGKSLFRHLVCGTEWESLTTNVLQGSGCPECAGNTKVSVEQVNERLALRDIAAMEPLVSNTKTPITFRCALGHEWLASPNNILNGKGCPMCARYGFNPSKSAWEYIFERDGYLKYGITNDLERRLAEHRRHGEFVLIHERRHDDGSLALEWENKIKRLHGGSFVPKERCPDGYTETLPTSLASLLLG